MQFTIVNGTETWITECPLSVDIGFFFISLFVDFYICTGICSVFIGNQIAEKGGAENCEAAPAEEAPAEAPVEEAAAPAEE